MENLNDMIKLAESIGGRLYRGPLHIDEIQRTIVQIIDPTGNVIGFEEEMTK